MIGTVSVEMCSYIDVDQRCMIIFNGKLWHNVRGIVNISAFKYFHK